MTAPTATVRDAAFDVMRRHGMTTIYSNPGSTEIPFLVDLPDDLDFVLALHEASVVGIATGWALATREPAFVLLHTTAGFGNAVGAIATARTNHAPLVAVVGQQDRRHLARQPFLAGELDGLAGTYPLETLAPVRAQDVPSAIERAAHRARREQGPVVVIVPMDDWSAPYDPVELAAARRVIEATPASVDVADLVALVADADAPAIVAGSGNDSSRGWSALVALAERLGAPVWQEAFGARAGFPQDHPSFRGQLPAGRTGAREVLVGADLVIVVGAAAFRQYAYEPGRTVDVGTRVAVVTADPAEAERSIAELAVVGDPVLVAEALVRDLGPGGHRAVKARRRESSPPTGDGFGPAAVFGVLADELPADAVLVEESPSSRPLLHAMVPARRPFGFVSAAMGGLGFAMPASIGIKLARPDRPVVAVVGDGSAMYAIQSLWTAARRGVGIVCIVMANGRYAVMDGLAEAAGGKPAWPAFADVSVGRLAEALGCEVVRVGDVDALRTAVATAAGRTHPLVIEAAVSA